ncbi:sensor histidine kinase [Tunturiibacter psychrotolerans]|uniref:sensor histidine kinase n=1 Tax=Tunturiibacter psychrotolerans TaxID=3069686 RepID=UPI003D1F823B
MNNPTAHLSPWYAVSTCLVLLGLQYITHWLRVRSIRRELALRSEERLHVAQELNDKLLQTIYGLTLHLNVVVDTLPENEPVMRSLRLALARADEVYSEVRSSLEKTRAQSLNGTDFAVQLTRMFEEPGICPGIGFRVVEDGKRRELEISAQQELSRIVRQALTNASLYSNTSTAQVLLTYSSSELVCRIYDNGTGISSSSQELTPKNPVVRGLIEMRNLTITLGGGMKVWSSPGRGTEIEVRVPANRAYKIASA